MAPINPAFGLMGWRLTLGTFYSSRMLFWRGFSLDLNFVWEKYINPPHTTDFAILFLPTEGLFAEILRRPGICDRTLHDRIVLAGPTTLAALLSSLQMGFRTLAIEKRSTEVWDVLAAVKTEFGKFGNSLANVAKKLDEASNKLGEVRTRSNGLTRRLRDVHEMPGVDSERILELDPLSIAAVADDPADSPADVEAGEAEIYTDFPE